jgi:hypothetical protein
MNALINRPLLPAGKIQRLQLFEYSLYAIILVAALCIPFFLGVYTNFGWTGVWFDWVRLLPFVLIFLVNNFLLLPRLLFRDKYLWYILTCILSVIVVVYLSGFLLEAARPELMSLQNMTPRGNMPPPPFGNPNPQAGFMVKPVHPFFHFGRALIAILLIGFNSGTKTFVRWNEERVRQADRERQYLYTELAFLKHQISPHFFMNTLNNIHSLIDIDVEKAKDAVVRLSRLMRYLLNEAEVQKVSLKKEIEFIESYIDLMRLRYDDDVLTVDAEYPAITKDIIVPSFLFVSFIENAFKHGVDAHVHSVIRIRFVHENGRLIFTVGNKKSEAVASILEPSGIGLENVKKRLDLIYKDDYKLEVRSTNEIYETYLNIPV